MDQLSRLNGEHPSPWSKFKVAPRTVKCLLKHGAHFDIVNSGGLIPLDLAMFDNHIAVFKRYLPVTLKCLCAKKILSLKISLNHLDLPLNITKSL